MCPDAACFHMSETTLMVGEILCVHDISLHGILALSHGSFITLWQTYAPIIAPYPAYHQNYVLDNFG